MNCQFGRDVSVFGVHSIVLSSSSAAFVACLLERELDLPARVVCFAVACLNSAKRGLHTQSLELCAVRSQKPSIQSSSIGSAIASRRPARQRR
jgi:hypothetical protein